MGAFLVCLAVAGLGCNGGEEVQQGDTFMATGDTDCAPCDDGKACTTDTQITAQGPCAERCAFEPIESCSHDDGCCPSSCTYERDNDCPYPDTLDACSDVQKTACISNYDCLESERCQDIGTAYEIPCCITGARGTGEAGDTCSSENDCASGFCISRNQGDSLCSQQCTNADDCPDNMKDCVSIMFIEGMWCTVPN